MTKRNIILTTAVLALFALMATAASGSKGAGRADAAKSRYYYYEGLRQETDGNTDAAYECFKRAWRLDTENLEAGFKLGVLRGSLMTADMQSGDSLRGSLALMRRFVDAYPTELYEGMQYGYAATEAEDSMESIRVMSRLADEYPDRGMILLLLSQAYHNSGHTPEAVEVMDRYEKLEGKSAALSLHKMSMMLESSDTAGAVREADRLIATDPKNPDFLILKGNLYDAVSKPDSAEYYYLAAEAAAPESGTPKMALMETYHAKGDSAAYDRKAYEALLTEDLDRDEKIQLLGMYMRHLIMDQSSADRGVHLFDVLLQQYPHDWEVLEFASRYAGYRKNYPQAEEYIGYAIDQNPTNEQLWRQKMYIQVSADDAAGALRTYEEAATKVPLSRDLRVYGAMLMHQAKNYSKSLEIYRGVVADIDSGLHVDTLMTLRDVRRDISMEELNMLSDVLSAMGDVAINLGDTTGSYRNYTNALEMNPDNALAANNFAYFSAMHGGDLDRALQLSSRSLEGENANNPTYLDTYAWILFLKGDYEKAREVQAKAVEIMGDHGGDTEVYEHYGDILDKTGDKAAAIEAWKKALDIDDSRNDIREKIKNAEKETQQ